LALRALDRFVHFRTGEAGDGGVLRRCLRAQLVSATDQQRRFVSRVAKSDRIFRIMVESAIRRREIGVVGGFASWFSQKFFLDREEDAEFHVSHDGFVNILGSPPLIGALSNPADYLMRPYSSLSAPRPKRGWRQDHDAAHWVDDADLQTPAAWRSMLGEEIFDLSTAIT
ncbi:MAG: hypothetical protein AAF360_06370, partial [Pseudomonadota bacterium]